MTQLLRSSLFKRRNSHIILFIVSISCPLFAPKDGFCEYTFVQLWTLFTASHQHRNSAHKHTVTTQSSQRGSGQECHSDYISGLKARTCHQGRQHLVAHHHIVMGNQLKQFSRLAAHGSSWRASVQLPPIRERPSKIDTGY